jgi:hypothetical protein
MAKKVKDVLTNKTASSKAVYTIMGHRSDGDIMRGKGPKPSTKADKSIHLNHIVDSGYYNLRHSFDHTDELAFDFQRQSKDAPDAAKALQAQTMRILNPNFRKMNLILEKK